MWYISPLLHHNFCNRDSEFFFSNDNNITLSFSSIVDTSMINFCIQFVGEPLFFFDSQQTDFCRRIRNKDQSRHELGYL